MTTTYVNEPVARLSRRGGFSMVELVIAIVILAVGVLGLAGTTAFVVRQITLADVNTERSAATQEVVERLRATSYSAVAASSMTSGPYTVSWTLVDTSTITKNLRVITTGPGLRKDTVVSVPALGPNVADTFNLILLKP